MLPCNKREARPRFDVKNVHDDGAQRFEAERDIPAHSVNARIGSKEVGRAVEESSVMDSSSSVSVECLTQDFCENRKHDCRGIARFRDIASWMCS